MLRVEKSLEGVSEQEMRTFLSLAQNNDQAVVDAAFEYVKVLAGNSGRWIRGVSGRGNLSDSAESENAAVFGGV